MTVYINYFKYFFLQEGKYDSSKNNMNNCESIYYAT